MLSSTSASSSSQPAKPHSRKHTRGNRVDIEAQLVTHSLRFVPRVVTRFSTHCDTTPPPLLHAKKDYSPPFRPSTLLGFRRHYSLTPGHTHTCQSHKIFKVWVLYVQTCEHGLDVDKLSGRAVVLGRTAPSMACGPQKQKLKANRQRPTWAAPIATGGKADRHVCTNACMHASTHTSTSSSKGRSCCAQKSQTGLGSIALRSADRS